MHAATPNSPWHATETRIRLARFVWRETSPAPWAKPPPSAFLAWPTCNPVKHAVGILLGCWWAWLGCRMSHPPPEPSAGGWTAQTSASQSWQRIEIGQDKQVRIWSLQHTWHGKQVCMKSLKHTWRGNLSEWWVQSTHGVKNLSAWKVQSTHIVAQLCTTESGYNIVGHIWSFLNFAREHLSLEGRWTCGMIMCRHMSTGTLTESRITPALGISQNLLMFELIVVCGTRFCELWEQTSKNWTCTMTCAGVAWSALVTLVFVYLVHQLKLADLDTCLKKHCFKWSWWCKILTTCFSTGNGEDNPTNGT